MVEVFRTDVQHPGHARLLLDQIHRHFTGYTANFDLNDCDCILRVQSGNDHIQTSSLVELLGNFGFRAEVLPD